MEHFDPTSVTLGDDWAEGATAGGGAPPDFWAIGFAVGIAPNTKIAGFDVQIDLWELPQNKAAEYATILQAEYTSSAAKLAAVNGFLSGVLVNTEYQTRDLLSLPHQKVNGQPPEEKRIKGRKRDLLTRKMSMLYTAEEARKGGSLAMFLSGDGNERRPLHLAFHGGGNVEGRKFDAVTFFSPLIWAKRLAEGSEVPAHWRDGSASTAGGAPSAPGAASGAAPNPGAPPPPKKTEGAEKPPSGPPPAPTRTVPPPPPPRRTA